MMMTIFCWYCGLIIVVEDNCFFFLEVWPEHLAW
jgi:hypothetical protein